MTVLQLIGAILKEMPNLDAEVKLTVHCPHGGNCLPVNFDNIGLSDDKKQVFLNLYPTDGVEYEVFDREEDEDNDI